MSPAPHPDQTQSSLLVLLVYIEDDEGHYRLIEYPQHGAADSQVFVLRNEIYWLGML